MQHAQLMLKAIFQNMLNPLKWPRIPAMLNAFNQSVDTDIPTWLWPRLAFNILLVGPEGIDSRTISRQMVVPFTTSGGASVLAPNWQLIQPVLKEIFIR
jgi:anionic cell wall polymer biosynthesis LytR-Cps2A-Psr (LCP) family protein